MNVARISKGLLLASVALFYTLVVLNNTTDYNSNYQFIRHVMQMDTTFPGNNGMWRAVNYAWVHTIFYAAIIAWETATGLLCWWAAAAMLSPNGYRRGRRVAISALTLGMLMWLVVFLCVGGEWFLMWQSKISNGQDVGFRMFTVLGTVLIYVSMPEAQEQSADGFTE